MKKKNNLLTLWALSAFILLIALTLTTATFAWFTANRKVQTDRITARSGAVNVELQISRTGGAGFSPGTGEDEAGNRIGQVALNDQDKDKPLMPVSTADLTHFWSAITFDTERRANGFALDGEGKYYYHDTVYLRAVGKDMPADTQLDLFLESDAGKFPIVRSEDGKMLTAARLGLVIGGESPRIIKLSAVDSDAQTTYLNGALLPAGYVLGYADGAPVGVPDPSVTLDSLRFDPADLTRRPLTAMKLNQIYQVDVYFYLEGCDPDCRVETVALTDAYLQLAFYGMLRQ